MGAAFGVGTLFGGALGSLLSVGAACKSRPNEILKMARTGYIFGGIVGGPTGSVAAAVACPDCGHPSSFNGYKVPKGDDDDDDDL